jgi:hypothetical protein
MRVYKLDENLQCKCGHKWIDHHHGVVQNPEYYDYPLTINGCIGEECEYNQFEGYFSPRHGEKVMCLCNNFKPRSLNVQKLVNQWRKEHKNG